MFSLPAGEQYHIYKDFQDLETKDLNPAATALLNKYIAEIKAATDECAGKSDPAKTWYEFAKGFINDVMFDTFKAYGVFDPTKVGSIEPFVCGSLGKQQCTPYSDFDGFIICKTEEDANRIKDAIAGMRQLFNRIFAKTHQFCPDPIGINPFTFCGAVDQLYRKLAQGEVPDVVAFIRALATAKPLWGTADLLPELMSKIGGNQNLQAAHGNAADLYDSAVNKFHGPNDKSQIHIKKDIFRPLDFIIMALREEFKIKSDDGKHLPTPNAVMELVEKGAMSREVADLILSIFKDAMRLRIKKHTQSGEEADIVRLNDTTMLERAQHLAHLVAGNNELDAVQMRELAVSLIHRMAILRGIAAQRLNALNTGNAESTSSSRCFEITGLKDLPYQTSGDYVRTDINFDVSQYMYSDQAREFIEARSAAIRNYIAQTPITNEYGIEGIFAQLEGRAAHLEFLIDGLNNCFDNGILSEEKLNVWFNAALQKGMNDLFDSNGNLHGWLKNILSGGNRTIDFDRDDVKKKLLISYIHKIIDIATNSRLLGATHARTPAEVLPALINQKLRDYHHKIHLDAGKTLSALAKEKENNFGVALRSFAGVVAETVRKLEGLRDNEEDLNTVAKLTTRITKYKRLVGDLGLAANSSTALLKGTFFNRAVDHFNADLNQLKNELPPQKLSWLTLLKEALLGFIGWPFEKALTRQQKLEGITYGVKFKASTIGTKAASDESLTESMIVRAPIPLAGR